jgi:hypothetical protein
VRRRDLDASQPRVKTLQRVCVSGWRDLVEGHRLVVRPKGQGEAVTFIDARVDPRLKRRDWAPQRGEPQSELDLERGDLLPHQCHSGEDFAR